MNSNSSFAQQFKNIDRLLSLTRQYWQIMPFEHLDLPWSQNQRLREFLQLLSVKEMERLDLDDVALRQKLTIVLGETLDIIEPLPCSEVSLPSVAPWFKAGIKGRKWQQIERFSATIPSRNTPILEWCAGKGHLGRVISYVQQREVVSLEWQQSLCQQGGELASKHKIRQSFVHADVFSSDINNLLSSHQHAVALHACGDLHIQLIKRASRCSTNELSVAPCCYHLIAGDTYQPLSKLAQLSDLHLSKQDLSLSMAQTVVASARERKHRATEVAWRLAFDILQRKLTGVDQYLSLPPIRQSILTGSFEQFCEWACDKKFLIKPALFDYTGLERQGWQRRELNARIEVVTHAFRELLERWLLLDRVLFLEQAGYQVSLSQFCPRQVTPRNAMIYAQRITE